MFEIIVTRNVLATRHESEDTAYLPIRRNYLGWILPSTAGEADCNYA
jgi:hypothetical protein